MTLPPEALGLLADHGWAGAKAVQLGGDASARRYWRLSKAGGTAILAFSPGPGGTDEARRFAAIGQWLGDRGYSAPRLIGSRTDEGLLLLEDLGDDLFSAHLRHRPGDEAELYQATAGFLADLARHDPPQGLPRLDGPGLSALLDLVAEWYCPATGGVAEAARGIGPVVERLYRDFDAEPPVLSLRDFHAENLIWLPGRTGIARVGLLDFQDAVATHPAYDVVSLIEDARRDVSEGTRAVVLDTFLGRFGQEQGRIRGMVALLGAQRALRIMGVFARLCLGSGKDHYLTFLPRVWANLERNLSHPDLAPLAKVVQAALPVASEELIHRIRAQCGTRPFR